MSNRTREKDFDPLQEDNDGIEGKNLVTEDLKEIIFSDNDNPDLDFNFSPYCPEDDLVPEIKIENTLILKEDLRQEIESGENSSILEMYFREINRKLLTPAEEIYYGKIIRHKFSKIIFVIQQLTDKEENSAECFALHKLLCVFQRWQKRKIELDPTQPKLNTILKILNDICNKNPHNEKLQLLKEEVDLLANDLKGAKDEMILANLRLVVSIAKRFRGKGLNFIDLIEEGNLGLMLAVFKFDYREGYRFSTCAAWWIRQAIGYALSNQTKTIRVPVYMQEKIRILTRTISQFKKKEGREPSIFEMAKKLETDVEEIEKLLSYAQTTVSLDTPLSSRAGETGDYLIDFIEAPRESSPDERHNLQQIKEQIKILLATLSPREEKVLRLRFGIGAEEQTLEEVGKGMNVTRERIRQIEQKALRRLETRGYDKKHPQHEKIMHLKIFLND